MLTASRSTHGTHAKALSPVFWSRQHSSLDWSAQVAQTARLMDARLRRELPEQWVPAIDIILPRKPIATATTKVTGGDIHSWNLDRVNVIRAFEHEHHDVMHWSVGDSTIIARAKRCATTVDDLLNGHHIPMTLQERLDTVIGYCERLGVDLPNPPRPPKHSATPQQIAEIVARGVIARAVSEKFWRAALRKKARQISELAGIRLGVINWKTGGYASDLACRRRVEQNARNRDLLKRTKVVNEAGQIYSLAELAALSPSNRDIRRGELMTRIRGCEEIADAAGHVGIFFTLTCPSRFHAVLFGGKNRLGKTFKPFKNKKYQGSSPSDAQEWLNKTWQKARAKLGRRGIKFYGFRVAEPHHDGCPHWHALFWFASHDEAAEAQAIIRDYWLKDEGNEPGARKNRVNCEWMDKSKGGAASYVSKYISKNIGAEGGGDVQLGDHTDVLNGIDLAMDTREYKGWQRVDAWASTWNIRQFQPVGQPSVTVWREMRRVTKDQIEHAQHRLDFGDDAVLKAWWAVHKLGTIKASWAGYVKAQGGMCRKRKHWKLRAAVRVEEGCTNIYGETITRKKVVGVETIVGHWLVSRRQAWKSCVGAADQDKAEREALGRPWTRFNNCTARMGRENLRQILKGDKPWQNDFTTEEEAEIRRESRRAAIAKLPKQPKDTVYTDAEGIRTTFRMPDRVLSMPMPAPAAPEQPQQQAPAMPTGEQLARIRARWAAIRNATTATATTN